MLKVCDILLVVLCFLNICVDLYTRELLTASGWLVALLGYIRLVAIDSLD